MADKNNLYGSYYSIYSTDSSNIEELVKKQKLFFNKIKNTDISGPLVKIKSNYKSYVKTVLTDDEHITSIKNLYAAKFNTDIL